MLLEKKQLNNSFRNTADLKALDIEVQLDTVKTLRSLFVIPHGVGFYSLEINLVQNM